LSPARALFGETGILDAGFGSTLPRNQWSVDANRCRKRRCVGQKVFGTTLQSAEQAAWDV